LSSTPKTFLGKTPAEVLEVGLTAVKKGERILTHYYQRLGELGIPIEEKLQAGLVTQADLETEQVIQESLRQAFPEADFLGEEGAFRSGGKQSAPRRTEGRWILDPLDGTTNFIHGLSAFCTSLGFEVGGRVQVAIINAPLINGGELYTAIRGQGAYFNGKLLPKINEVSLKNSLLATGFFPDFEDNLQEQLRIFSELVRKCRGIRRLGSAAYDLALVSRGVYNLFWEKNLNPWDIAAGSLLVEEVGGKVTTYRGREDFLFANSILAGPPGLQERLQLEIAPLLFETTD
jgi:myo-inositol-1(or 4)-monophosphatase